MGTVDVLFQGFPGWSPTHGRIAWPSLALIHQGNKKILFDTGHTGIHKLLLDKLLERGTAREDVDMLVLSHTHWDHILGYHLFPNAEIVIGKRELDWALGTEPAEALSIPPHLPEHISRHPRLTTVDGDTEILPGLTMIDTPGHTPGHMSLVVITDEGRVVLAQDAVKNRAEFLARKAVQTMDDAASTASIQKVASLADVVVPGHDRTFRVEGEQTFYQGELKAEFLVKSSPALEEETVFTITLR